MKYLKIGILTIFVLAMWKCDAADEKAGVDEEKVPLTQRDTLDTLTKTAKAPTFKTEEDMAELYSENYVLDLRYATANNFIDSAVYPCARCFLHPPAALALEKARMEFEKKGYRIKVFDCYRPHKVQKALWMKVPNEQYVAHPDSGSMHNRALAVDMTLVDRDGNELDMGTGFDDFSKKSHHDHTELPAQVLKNRKLLKTVMEKHGFEPIRTEWWHYSYPVEGVPVYEEVWKCK